ncbi:hypothetical protein HYPSUDRAFT_33272 [Hypholoma sublateritium FD-334 SS-4]|uniref:BZIP domain-containing protein n=1 Tax=Hypholoma sublateritium (strain FD-334 SS-4) TaxID=945553 RepID=A0A0D2LLM2_HYPSF|nr:hypothetical protein HYPSUDRAFT_33272 [Hypholoma sublateritium FD-334 SS-4]
MHSHSLSLQMSQIISADAPLLSPTDACWDAADAAFAYYQLPPSPPLSDEAPSPPPAARMLRAPLSPAICVPTHQLFDIGGPRPPTPPSRSPSLAADDDDPCAARKRSASPTPGAPRKRAVGERISSKDFVPPDVSGLSKREARLVKNRAAAFLSRQRKREEFECMEVRVAELEQENARLQALSASAEVDQLRAQLAAAAERERALAAQLASPVKLEAAEPFLCPRPPQHKGASLGLMVLLCALPSLLAMRLPLPSPFAPAPAYDFAAVPEYAWAAAPQRLAFAPDDDAALAALGDLAVSFEAAPADPRTIRVRIHPASESSPPPQSPAQLHYPAPWDADPFLGAPDFAAPFAPDGSLRYDLAQLPVHPQHQPQHTHHAHSHQQPFSLDVPLDFAALDAMGFGAYAGGAAPHELPLDAPRTRVRIALKSAPAPGGEGGEWEVSLC